MANRHRLWKEFDYYQLLGIPKDASDDDIKAAVNRRIKDWHPDRQRGQSSEIYRNFARLTTAVNAAREDLLNPRLRREYNEFRETLDPRQQGDDDHERQQQRDRERQQQRQREQEERQRREQREREERREYERQQREQERQRAQRKQEREQREREEYERLQQEREQRRQREWERQREYERQQQRERAEHDRRKREREAQHDRPPWERETNYTPSRNTPKTKPASAIAPNPAATVAYAILAILALAAAGALIYGFVQALPAIINFLKQLLIWTVAIALLVGVIVAAAVASSGSRN